MAESFYLTTPLYYVNAKPHIGHAYTTVVADALARAHRQRGEEVFLLTGTDEHGEKIALAAKAQGLSPKEFADRTSGTFLSLWKLLGISYDHFIRTTDPEHEKAVQRALETLQKNGALKAGTYTFWYCVPCETGWAASDFPDLGRKACPTCGRAVEQVTEEDYFLDLEQHRAWLKGHIQANPAFIQPETRRNEVLAMLGKPLPPLCVTRPKERVSWGIEVPFSPTQSAEAPGAVSANRSHVTYVWFDALLNYISALGWPDGEKFKRYWSGAGAVHLVGKDIIRHHCLYWPIILHALGVAPPKTVFAHGWWLIRGEKMSKSLGNIVDPQHVVETFGLDAFRYFLMRDVPFGDDGVFSEEAITKRINSDLANDLGNLAYRTLTMLEKHTGGKIPAGKMEEAILGEISAAEKRIWAALQAITPSEALKALWELITRANKLVEEKAPWTLAKEGKRAELEAFLHQMAGLVRSIALLTWPFMPTTSESIWAQMGFISDLSKERLPAALTTQLPAGQAIRKGSPLFPRLQ